MNPFGICCFVFEFVTDACASTKMCFHQKHKFDVGVMMMWWTRTVVRFKNGSFVGSTEFCAEPSPRKSQTIFKAHQQVMMWWTRTVIEFKNGGSVDSALVLHWTMPLKIKQFLGHTNLMTSWTRTVFRFGNGGSVDFALVLCWTMPSNNQTIFGAQQQMNVWSILTVVGFGIGDPVDSAEFLHWTKPSKNQTIFGAHQPSPAQFLGHTNLMMWSTSAIVGFKNGSSVESTLLLQWT